MLEPLISIIVPIYKVEQYLDECIETLVNQTYNNLEIILVDDGSPDNCPRMCDDWAKKDNRIKVIHKKNGGLSAARNTGLDIAKGEYIGFVDSDDFVDKRMYEILIDKLIKSNKKIAYCEPHLFFEDGTIKELREKGEGRLLDIRESLDAFFYRKMFFSVWSKLYKREVFENIRFPEGETNEDYPILIPTVLNSNGVFDTGEILYYYRVREGSITDSYWKTDANILLKNLRIMERQLDDNGLFDLKSFKLFLASESFNCATCLDKHYDKLNDEAKKNIKNYIKIMKENKKSFLFSKNFTIRDKVLYYMIMTRTLRPVYKMLGRL